MAKNPHSVTLVGQSPASRPSLEREAQTLSNEITRFLKEDLGEGDITTQRVVPEEAFARGYIIARENCVVAGIEIARAVFLELDARLDYRAAVQDGEGVAVGTPVARLQGRAAPILTGERVALNLLQRLSGIATLTRQYVEAVAGTGIQIYDTRKTTPGLRWLEKFAVRAGGGQNHRAGLYDAVLIKDNHIAIAGGLSAAVRRVRSADEGRMTIQVEVESFHQLGEALDLAVEAVLLDNMAPERVAQAVQLIRGHPNGQRCWIEASGGITLENIRSYRETGVDAISVGALTHSARAVDLALEVQL